MIFNFACVKDKGEVLDKENQNAGKSEIDKSEQVVEEAEKKKDEREGEVIMDKDEKNISYKDHTYGFSLELPYSWEENYIVESESWMDDEGDSICFNFKNDKITSNIFQIIVMDESILEEEWEDPFLIYIIEKDGRTFAYLPAMEAEEELLKEENIDELNIITNMVEDVPGIIESFKL